MGIIIDEDGAQRLAGAVIHKALDDLGVAWLKTDGGRFWCSVAGLSLDAMERLYLKKNSEGKTGVPEHYSHSSS